MGTHTVTVWYIIKNITSILKCVDSVNVSKLIERIQSHLVMKCMIEQQKKMFKIFEHCYDDNEIKIITNCTYEQK